MKTLAALICLCIFTAAALRAEPSPPPLPDGPLIVPSMPAESRWTITISYPPRVDDAQSQASYQDAMKKTATEDPAFARLIAANPTLLVRPARLEGRAVIKSGDIRMETLQYENGRRGERWRIGKTELVRDAFTSKVSVELFDSSGKLPDFPEFSWIDRGNFTEIKAVEGKQCLIFVSKIEPVQIDDPRLASARGRSKSEEAAQSVTAAIEVETRLPVSIVLGDQTRRYRFEAPPEEPLKLPADLEAKFREVQKKVRALSAPLSRP